MVFTERKNPYGNFVMQVDIYLHCKWSLFQIYRMEERRVDDSYDD